jgi:hypothetical protein
VSSNDSWRSGAHHQCSAGAVDDTI